MTTILTDAHFDTNVREPRPGGDLKMAFASMSEGRPSTYMELDHDLGRIRCVQRYQDKDHVRFINMAHVVSYTEAPLPEVESVPDVSQLKPKAK